MILLMQKGAFTMDLIKDILKGAIIGIANIIPGVSGGTMAVSMGIYDRLISAITSVFKHFKKSMRVLIPVILGAAIGIIVLSYIITPALERYPLQTSCLFIGLILGGLPMLTKHVKGARIRFPEIIVFILFFALVIGMAFFKESESNVTDIVINFGTMIQLFLMGLIASATMIIPGVSGSMVMMVLGFYNIIISNIKTFINALLGFDIPALIHGFGIFVPFGIGVLVGIGIVAKLIEILFEKQPTLTYCGILGLVIASPIAILYSVGFSSLNFVSIIISIITFVIGFVIASVLGKEE